MRKTERVTGLSGGFRGFSAETKKACNVFQL